MGKTSSTVKDRYNAKAYDEIKLRVPKGRKADIKAHTEQIGETVNGYINKLFCKDMGINSDEWAKRI